VLFIIIFFFVCYLMVNKDEYITVRTRHSCTVQLLTVMFSHRTVVWAYSYNVNHQWWIRQQLDSMSSWSQAVADHSSSHCRRDVTNTHFTGTHTHVESTRLSVCQFRYPTYSIALTGCHWRRAAEQGARSRDTSHCLQLITIATCLYTDSGSQSRSSIWCHFILNITVYTRM